MAKKIEATHDTQFFLNLFNKLDNNKPILKSDILNEYIIVRDDELIDNEYFNIFFNWEECDESEWYLIVKPVIITYKIFTDKVIFNKPLIDLVSFIKRNKLKRKELIKEKDEKTGEEIKKEIIRGVSLFEVLEDVNEQISLYLDIDFKAVEIDKMEYFNKFIEYILNHQYIIKHIRGYYSIKHKEYFEKLNKWLDPYEMDETDPKAKLCSIHLLLNYVDTYKNINYLVRKFKTKCYLLDTSVCNNIDENTKKSVQLFRNVYTWKNTSTEHKPSYIKLNENDTVLNIAKSFIHQTNNVNNLEDIEEIISDLFKLFTPETEKQKPKQPKQQPKPQPQQQTQEEEIVFKPSIFDNIFDYDLSLNMINTALFFAGKSCVLTNEEFYDEIYNFLIKFKNTTEWTNYNVHDWLINGVIKHIKITKNIYQQNINNIFILFKWLKQQYKFVHDAKLEIKTKNNRMKGKTDETQKQELKDEIEYLTSKIKLSETAIIKLENYINKYKKLSFTSNNHFNIDECEDMKRKYKIYLHSFKDINDIYYFIKSDETIETFNSFNKFINYLDIKRNTKLHDYIKNNIMIFKNKQEYIITRLNYIYEYVLNQDEIKEINDYSQRLLDLLKETFEYEKDYENYLSWWKTKLSKPNNVISKNIINCPSDITETGHDSLKTYFKDRFTFMLEEKKPNDKELTKTLSGAYFDANLITIEEINAQKIEKRSTFINTLKTITNTDSINYEAKGKDAVTITPRFNIYINTNFDVSPLFMNKSNAETLIKRFKIFKRKTIDKTNYGDILDYFNLKDSNKIHCYGLYKYILNHVEDYDFNEDTLNDYETFLLKIAIPNEKPTIKSNVQYSKSEIEEHIKRFVTDDKNKYFKISEIYNKDFKTPELKLKTFKYKLLSDEIIEEAGKIHYKLIEKNIDKLFDYYDLFEM